MNCLITDSGVLMKKAVQTLLLCFLVSFSNQLISEELAPPGVSIDQLIEHGVDFMDKEVFVSGYLLIDNGMHLFKNLESFDSPDLYQTINILSKNSDVVPKSLSGCMVHVIATVKAHHGRKNTVVLDNVRVIGRSGMFYIFAKKKMEAKGLSGEPKCVVDAITDVMSQANQRSQSH